MTTPNPYQEIAGRFASADRAELTRSEWEWLSQAFQDNIRLGSECSRLRAELERVRRIGRPLWRAAARVRQRMRGALERAPGAFERVPRCDVVEWERQLRHAMTLDTKDAPPGHPLHSAHHR